MSDFSARLHKTGGRLFWIGPEAVTLLDYLFASGKTREPAQCFINWLELLELQSGGQFGPISIKSSDEELLAPRTNVGIFHAGQPICIQRL